METKGYNNKILKIDLTQKEISYDYPGDAFYRQYVGGANLGAYYLLQNYQPNIKALDAENIIVFAASPLTGTPVPGFSRHSVISRSPLTGAIIDSEAGGFFGAELKKAGYDAIVIKGKAKEPVYLAIIDEQVTIRSAKKMWGQTTKEAEIMIREDLEQAKAVVTQIGPAGENMVSFACLVNNLKHFNGRGGLGAVMGSKNLKAIAVKGNGKVKVADSEIIKAKVKKFVDNFKDNPFNNLLHQYGTAGIINIQNTDGQLPTFNFKTGVFAKAENLSGENIAETIFNRAESCYACPVRCKMGVVNHDQNLTIDAAYGGPEYEALAALGSYTGVDHLITVAKANELCNKNGLDAISTGNIIAFAMECYEKGIISKEQTQGIELKFGNKEALLKLIEAIVNREGLGALLAQGIEKASQELGVAAQSLALHVKGLDFPAHDPRGKVSYGLAYAVAPIGADHITHFGDPSLSKELFDTVPDPYNSFGFYNTQEPLVLDKGKAVFFYYGQLINSFYDVFDICTFTTTPGGTWQLDDILDLIKAVTDWNYSAWELMKLGERRINMLKAFNLLNGIDRKADKLPPRMFEAIQSGPRKGAKLDEAALNKTIEDYYQAAGWDNQGVPNSTKLLELGLAWVDELLQQRLSK